MPIPGKRKKKKNFAPPETPWTQGGFRTAGMRAQRGVTIPGLFDFGLDLSPPWKDFVEALVLLSSSLITLKLLRR